MWTKYIRLEKISRAHTYTHVHAHTHTHTHTQAHVPMCHLGVKCAFRFLFLIFIQSNHSDKIRGPGILQIYNLIHALLEPSSKYFRVLFLNWWVVTQFWVTYKHFELQNLLLYWLGRQILFFGLPLHKWWDQLKDPWVKVLGSGV